jgi:hypothetical protein
LVHSKWTDRIVHLLLIPAVLVYSLFLPPARLGERLFRSDLPLVTPDEGGLVQGYAGASLTVPAGAVEKRTRIGMDALGGAELDQLPADSPERLAAQRVPEGLLSIGPWHRLMVTKATPSTAEVSLPIPRGLGNTDLSDLYAWTGEAWEWIPSRLDADGLMVEASLEGVPSLLMLAQNQALPARVALNAGADEVDTAVKVAGTSMLSLEGLVLGADGAVEGEAPAAAATSSYVGDTILTVSNVRDGVVRSDLADNLLIDADLRAQHVAALVARVAPSAHSGLELAYAGVDSTLRVEFTALVTDLSAALHSAGKVLAVQVDAPAEGAAGWNTGAYDWVALGEVADIVRVPASIEPAAYAEDGAMDRLAAWAVRQINRRKLELIVPACSHAVQGEQTTPLRYEQALNLLIGTVQSDLTDGLLLPGQSVTVGLHQVPQVEFDPDAQVYWFETPGSPDGIEKVWLGNASSVARKLTYVTRYGLGGALVQDAADADNDADALAVVSAFQENIVPEAPQFAFVGTVENATGVQVAQLVTSLEDGRVSWVAPNRPGSYVIRAGVSDDGGNSMLNAVSQVNILVPTPTFTPTPTPTNTPTATPTATPTQTPTAVPTPKAAPAAPSVMAAPRSSATGGYFGYGIQVDMMSDGNHQRIFDHIRGIGFNWVKQQIEWFRYNPEPGVYHWGDIDRLVDGANANGINVMLSVVKAPQWSRPAGDTDQGPPADPNAYGTFIREMAARYKGRVKAYEIWNEQNLYYEWGGRGGKLNAGKYVELLKVAYNAVKSVDPGAVVISGALTPTGWNDGDIAIDDQLYLDQMYRAGLARYCDAIGAHPSGYNNPPDAQWTTWSDPTTSRAKGHPSWFFRSTLEGYRNTMIKYGDGGKRIWPTEFGWATVEGLGTAPAAGYEYAADNTEAEQAQFIVRAYQLGRAWGWVGPMFLWNLNFAPVAGAADEKAAFGIVRCDWSPRPAFAALRDMAK